MERIALFHLSGSKVNQTEKFPLNDFKEITVGRDPSSTVRFGEEPGTVVSRQHTRITRNIALPSQFFITDLDSRNGTYVNGQRVVGTVNLKPGDVVQCGAGGPEFRFAIEPDTEQITNAQAVGPTADLIKPARARPTSPNLPYKTSFRALPEPVVKTPVEQSKTPAKKRSSRRLIASGGVLLGVIALAAGVLFYRGIGSIRSGLAGTPAATPEASPSAGAATVVEVTPSPEATLATVTPSPEATLAAVTPAPETKVAAISGGNAGAAIATKAAPSRRGNTRPSAGGFKRPTGGRITNVTGKVTKKEVVDSKISAEERAKKAKKAKKEKEKKMKNKY